MINNILDSGKNDQGRLEIDPKPSDVRKIISDTWKIFSTIIKSKGLNGFTMLDTKIPKMIKIDPIRVT